jgi:hypothetical protein
MRGPHALVEHWPPPKSGNWGEEGSDGVGGEVSPSLGGDIELGGAGGGGCLS